MDYFLGIDQSYTSAGYCIVDEAGDVVKFGTIKTSEQNNGDIFKRALHVATTLISIASEYNIRQIGLEGLAFGKFGNATRDLAGLQFVIITNFHTQTSHTTSSFDIISPNMLKKFATNKGKASKEDMTAALPEAVLDSFKASNFKKSTGLYDLADAYWIARHTQMTYQKRKLTQSVVSDNSKTASDNSEELTKSS